MILLLFMFRYILYWWFVWSLCSDISCIDNLHVQIYPLLMICLICIVWETSMSCVDPGTWSRKLSPASRSTRRTWFIYSRGLRSMRILSCLKISVIYFRIKFEVFFRFLVTHRSELFIYFRIFICNAVKSFMFVGLYVCCIWFGFHPINSKWVEPWGPKSGISQSSRKGLWQNLKSVARLNFVNLLKKLLIYCKY